MLECLASAGSAIRRRSARSVWMAFGYAAAGCCLALAFALLTAARDSTSDALKTTGAQFIGFVVESTPSDRWRDPRDGRFDVHNNPAALFPLDRIDAIRRDPNVRNATPILSFLLNTGDGQLVRIAGFDPAEMEAIRCTSCSASQFTDGDGLSADDARTAIIEQTYAVAYSICTGDEVTFGDRRYTVKGIIEPGTRPVKSDIYLPYKDALDVLNSRLKQPLSNETTAVLVEGVNSQTHQLAIAAAKSILGPGASDAGYGCWNPAGKTIANSASGAGGLALLAAIVFIVWTAVSQLSAAYDERRDVAVLRAIGWSCRSVVLYAAAQTFLLSIIGGAVGALTAAILLASPTMTSTLDAGAPPKLSSIVFFTLVSAGSVIIAALLTSVPSTQIAAGVRPAVILREA